MIGTFGTDTLPAVDLANKGADVKSEVGGSQVALRMPYNLPLQSYGRHEEPWVATQTYTEPDCLGRTWDSWAR